jgi:hypothetical protein
MPKKQPKGPQLSTLPKIDLPQMSFNLKSQDDFIQGLGVKFTHYKAMPSPIGMKDRGEYRKSNQLDTIQENGMVYKKCGEFTAVFMGNSSSHNSVEGGVFDHSTARITLPRFYDSDSPSHANEEINLAVGDRVYIKEVEVKVVNYQRVEYSPKSSDYLQYPALCVEFLMDSNGVEYKEGVHFKIDKNGNIVWKSGKKNPGIDPDTGKGRVYSIRYKYNAHWYIVSLPNEVRITNITENDQRTPTRMPYHALIQREYVYTNRIRGDKTEEPKVTVEPSRVTPEPESVDNPNPYQIKVNVGNFSEN